ncbi:UNVERIFIED_CONTAM: hypothetical protein FKN15_004190 [Acipenser sinensis]
MGVQDWYCHNAPSVWKKEGSFTKNKQKNCEEDPRLTAKDIQSELAASGTVY